MLPQPDMSKSGDDALHFDQSIERRDPLRTLLCAVRIETMLSSIKWHRVTVH